MGLPTKSVYDKGNWKTIPCKASSGFTGHYDDVVALDSAGRIIQHLTCADSTTDKTATTEKVYGRLKTDVLTAATADDVVMVAVPVDDSARWYFNITNGASAQANADTLLDGTIYGTRRQATASTHASGLTDAYLVDIAVTGSTNGSWVLDEWDKTRDGETFGAGFFRLTAPKNQSKVL